MGVWDKIEEEDMSGSGNGIYFKPGAYPLLRVKECKFKDAAETYKKSDVFIALLEVVESDVAEYKPGTIIEYVVKERKSDGEPNTFYFKNIKKFLMACFNTDDHTDIDAKVMNLVLGEKQKAAGALHQRHRDERQDRRKRGTRISPTSTSNGRVTVLRSRSSSGRSVGFPSPLP
jgi:hypothetical protein